MQIVTVEAVLMDNGEIITNGTTIGWEKDLGKFIKTRRDAVTGQPIE